MIPIEQLKESRFYQYIVKEGLKEGREKGMKVGLKRGLKKGLQQGLEQGLQQGLEQGRERLITLLKSLAQQKFPGIKLEAEIETVHDLDVLQQLCLEVISTKSEKALRKKINEVVAANKGTHTNGTNKK